MYVVYIVDHIHHLLNEPKKSKFAYNSDQREYIFYFWYLQFLIKNIYRDESNILHDIIYLCELVKKYGQNILTQ